MRNKLLTITLLFFLLMFSTTPVFLHAESERSAMIPETIYSNDLIVADIIINSDYYDIDPTGFRDATDVINQAISDCFDLGGGTVFLPSGKYRVSSNITVLPFVTLQGDYHDPDSVDFNGEYGTMIYADVETSTENFPALFTVGGSAGVVGLTIYYPFQTTDNIKAYPYTFEVPSFASSRGHADHMASTIQDVTMINSYKGIAVSITPSGSLVSAANEMLHLENIKGTILYKGFELYNSSEYGVVKDITISNNYWKNVPSGLDSPDFDTLDEFTKEHSIGMQVGDLEWVVFTNINIEDQNIGIRVYDGLRRYIPGQPEIYFIGQFYDLVIQNTMTAVRVDNLYPNFGMNIASGYLSGEQYSIYRSDTTNSVVNLVGTTLNGSVFGNNIIESGANSEYDIQGFQSSEDQELDLTSIPKTLYNVMNYYADLSGTYDSSVAIQNALNDAHAHGGGIVYLPSGYYKLSNSLVVYENTILRGSTNINCRDEIGLSLGTVILSEYGYTLDENQAETGQALITVVGQNAGVMGLRIHYPLNIPDYVSGFVRIHTYSIRLMNNNNFVTHVSLVGVSYGIEVLGEANNLIDAPYILGVNGTYYRRGISLKYTSNAHLEELLSNGSVVSRHGMYSLFPQYYTNSWPSDANGGLTGVYDTITRPNSIFFTVESSTNVFIKDSFTFASNTFLLAVDSNVKMINNSGDNLYPTGYLLRLERSNLEAINLMRYSGSSLQVSNSSYTIYNRLSLLDNQEKDILESVEVADKTILATSSAAANLPSSYTYNPNNDQEMTYPISDPSISPETPDSPDMDRTWIYLIFGSVIVLLSYGIIIIVKKR